MTLLEQFHVDIRTRFKMQEFKDIVSFRIHGPIYLICVWWLIAVISFVACAEEQMPGTDVKNQASSFEYRASHEVQSYVALCKAVYWDHMSNDREARRQLATAIRLDPSSSFLYAKLAENSIALKDYKGAEAASKAALKFNPDNADAHYSLGLLNFMRQDRRGAIREFKAVTELKPEHFKAQYHLSSLLFGIEDYSGAARAYSEMVKLRPYDPKLRTKLGISYSNSGETRKAIKEFNAVTKLSKGYLEPHFHLAYL